MLKAHDVMTHTLATCAPDTTVSQAAAIMAARDIGNVLVVEDGKLRGIVTDRDLALKALTGPENPLQAPVSRFMSTDVVTAESHWNLHQLADVMARHQIRRLPILKAGQLVGIVSLGDVARYENREDVVSDSLESISSPHGMVHSSMRPERSPFLGLLMVALTGIMIGWLTLSPSGRKMRKQISKSETYHTAQKAVGVAVGKVGEVAASKPVRDVQRYVMQDGGILRNPFMVKPKKKKMFIFG